MFAPTARLLRSPAGTSRCMLPDAPAGPMANVVPSPGSLRPHVAPPSQGELAASDRRRCPSPLPLVVSKGRNRRSRTKCSSMPWPLSSTSMTAKSCRSTKRTTTCPSASHRLERIVDQMLDDGARRSSAAATASASPLDSSLGWGGVCAATSTTVSTTARSCAGCRRVAGRRARQLLQQPAHFLDGCRRSAASSTAGIVFVPRACRVLDTKSDSWRTRFLRSCMMKAIAG